MDINSSIDLNAETLRKLRKAKSTMAFDGLVSPNKNAEDRESLRSLRENQSSPRAMTLPVHQKICRFFADYFSFKSLTTMEKRSPMCVNYGHRIDRAVWKSGPAFCADCGATVTGMEQLRGSTPRAQKQ